MEQQKQPELSLMLDTATVIREEVNGLKEGLQRIYDRLESVRGLMIDDVINEYEKMITEKQNEIEKMLKIADMLESVYTQAITPEVYGPPTPRDVSSIIF